RGPAAHRRNRQIQPGAVVGYNEARASFPQPRRTPPWPSPSSWCEPPSPRTRTSPSTAGTTRNTCRRFCSSTAPSARAATRKSWARTSSNIWPFMNLRARRSSAGSSTPTTSKPWSGTTTPTSAGPQTGNERATCRSFPSRRNKGRAPKEKGRTPMRVGAQPAKPRKGTRGYQGGALARRVLSVPLRPQENVEPQSRFHRHLQFIHRYVDGTFLGAAPADLARRAASCRWRWQNRQDLGGRRVAKDSGCQGANGC